MNLAKIVTYCRLLNPGLAIYSGQQIPRGPHSESLSSQQVMLMACSQCDRGCHTQSHLVLRIGCGIILLVQMRKRGLGEVKQCTQVRAKLKNFAR